MSQVNVKIALSSSEEPSLDDKRPLAESVEQVAQLRLKLMREQTRVKHFKSQLIGLTSIHETQVQSVLQAKIQLQKVNSQGEALKKSFHKQFSILNNHKQVNRQLNEELMKQKVIAAKLSAEVVNYSTMQRLIDKGNRQFSAYKQRIKVKVKSVFNR